MLDSDIRIGKVMMFLTWQLWNALRFPKRRHPIFLYARNQSIPKKPTSRLWRVLQIAMIVSIVLFVILFPVRTIVTLLGIAVGISPLLIIFNGTVLGVIWVTGISTAIATANHDKRFDLMSISSYGALGVSWLLSTGHVHRHNWLKSAYDLVSWFVTIVLVLLGLAISMLIIGAIATESEPLQQQQISLLREVINISLLVCALWLDHIQSIVIAITLGIVLPKIIQDKTQLRGIAPILYLVMQVSTYLAIFIIYRLINIVLIGVLGNSFIVLLLISIITLFAFYAMRESIISVLWRVMLMKYDASVDDYQRAVNT